MEHGQLLIKHFLMKINRNKPQPVNRALIYWLLAGVICCLLITTSNVSVSWQRINPNLQQQITLFNYSLSVFFSYALWIGIVILIKLLAEKVPIFSQAKPHWWLVHLSLSLLVAFLHLLIDTFFLWWVFDFQFDFLPAFIQKLLTWLPYELLAYWASLGLITLLKYRKQFQLSKPQKYLEYLSIKRGDETQVIAVDLIDYFKACDNYVELWQQGQYHLINDSMNRLEAKLSPKTFVRIHRSFIINLLKLKSIQNKTGNRTVAILEDGTQIPVSRRKKSQLKMNLDAI